MTQGLHGIVIQCLKSVLFEVYVLLLCLCCCWNLSYAKLTGSEYNYPEVVQGRYRYSSYNLEHFVLLLGDQASKMARLKYKVLEAGSFSHSSDFQAQQLKSQVWMEEVNLQGREWIMLKRQRSCPSWINTKCKYRTFWSSSLQLQNQARIAVKFYIPSALLELISAVFKSNVLCFLPNRTSREDLSDKANMPPSLGFSSNQTSFCS